MLIHEVTFLRDQSPIAQLTLHSTAEIVGRSAREARAKRLALFHIPLSSEHREEEFRTEALDAYGKQVIVGTDLDSIEF